MLCFLNCLSDHAIASPLSVDSDIEFSHRFIFLFFFTNLRWPYVGTSIVVIGGPDVVGYWVLTGFSHLCSSVVCTPLCFFFSAVFSFLYFFKHPPVFIIFPPIPSTSATPPHPTPVSPRPHSPQSMNVDQYIRTCSLGALQTACKILFCQSVSIKMPNMSTKTPGNLKKGIICVVYGKNTILLCLHLCVAYECILLSTAVVCDSLWWWRAGEV